MICRVVRAFWNRRTFDTKVWQLYAREDSCQLVKLGKLKYKTVDRLDSNLTGARASDARYCRIEGGEFDRQTILRNSGVSQGCSRTMAARIT